MSLLSTPFSTESLDRNEGAFEHGTVRMFGYNDRRIQSGDIFELKTDDAITRPLPSFQLLEMQWFLTRVVGMVSAAFPYELHWGDEDSDGEISNLGLGYVNDDSFADPILPNTPEFVHKVNLLLTKVSKHRRVEVEGDGVGVGGGEYE
jgi:hypothetical protein